MRLRHDQPRGESPTRAHTPARRSVWVWLAVAGLLLAYAVMAYTASLTKGLSFDEGEQLAVGYNIWLNDDYRIEGANGDFIKRWATLPYLLSRPNFVGRDDPYWRRADPYEVGHRFFFAVGNRPESLLRQARAMAVLLGVATGLLVFWCSRKLFGAGGGLISLGLFVFSPHMLVFGGIVSTDMSITLLLLGSTWCIWQLLHEVTWGRVLASLVVFGLVLLAKLSALTILPITAVLVAVKLIAGGPLVVRWRARRWTLAGWRPQAAIFAALVVLHGICGWTAIWAHYGFRYAASPHPADPGLILCPLRGRDEVPRVFAAVIDWSQRTRFFPEGFRHGVEALLSSDDRLVSFMGGEWKLGGRRGFFPYTMWVKTQPALMLLVTAGAMCWAGSRRNFRAAPPGATARNTGPSLYDTAPHLVLIVVYLAVALTEDINLGHRHVLPVYPSVYVLAGTAALAWRAGWGRVVVALLLAWIVRDSLAIRPNYLAYFGAQAGGPTKGYTHLVDSSLDWGMNLPNLKRWLDKNNPGGKEPAFLAYFGTDNPDYYGIQAQRLPGFFDCWRKPSSYPLRPGYYAISASLLQGVYTAAIGPWSKDCERVYRTVLQNFEVFNRTKPGSPERQALIDQKPPKFWEDEFYVFEHLRFARLCAWLRHQGDPPYHVGHAIFIWKLDYASLQAALVGPPVELTDAPLFLRRL